MEANPVPKVEQTGRLPDRSEDHSVATKQRQKAWRNPSNLKNPKNWSSAKKSLHLYSVAFSAFSVTCGSSLVTPASDDLRQAFAISETAAILPLSVFVLGLALGPVIAAPLSEQFGRTVIVQISGLIYVLFLIGAGFSASFGSLIVCRLFAGISGAPVLAIGTGTTADLFQPKEYATAVSIFITAPFLGPALGPVIGGFAAYYKGWRWTVWCTIFIEVLALVLSLFMQETYAKIIQERVADQDELEQKPSTGTEQSSFSWLESVLSSTIIRPLQMLLMEPTVLAFSTYSAVTFSILFAYFAAYPYIFASVYGFDVSQSGLAFLAVGLGNVLGALVCVLLDRLIYRKRLARAEEQGEGLLPPEDRLYAAMLGAPALPVGLFWLAWTSRADVHWIVPILAGVPFAFGNITLFISTVLYLIDIYGANLGASAMAANGLMRYTFGACLPLVTIQMYEGLGIEWATSLLGFLCVILLPIPFVYYRFGPAIRARSRILAKNM